VIKSLYIENYALIESLHFFPGNHFNVITGETGAGKSILLNCMQLVFGHRADSKTIRAGANKCILELEVDLKHHDVFEFFEKNDLEFDQNSILRRELYSNGKSRAFLNDTPASLQVLKELGALLVDIHSQNQNGVLSNAAEQLAFLDEISENQKNQKEYSKKYGQRKALQGELDEKRKRQIELQKEFSYHSFLLEELEHFRPSAADDHLEESIKQFEKKEILQNQISAFKNAVEHEAYGISSLLGPILHALEKIDSSEDLRMANQRLAQVLNELNDLKYAYQDIFDSVSLIESQHELTERFDTFNGLLRKHQVRNSAELIDKWEEISSIVEKNHLGEEDINTLQNRIKALEGQMGNLADILNNNRKNAIPILEEYVAEELKKLGMPDTILKIELSKVEAFLPNGINQIQFLFSANKGQGLQSIKSVASGGEWSRLMLVLKSKLAQYKKLPTLIFDEIDSGVGGEIANKMAMMMEILGKKHQIISITHLPQVAGKADEHFFVSKYAKNSTTYSTINKLDENQRIQVLAEMLSGEKITPTSIAKAQELRKE